MIILETKRLIVKPISFDLDELHALLSDPEVMRYVGDTKTHEKIYEASIKMHKHIEKHGFGFGHVYEKHTGLWVGGAGLCYLEMNDNQPDIEVGFSINKNFWNQGYATELTKAFINWGFKYLFIEKLVAVMRIESATARRVLEKSGMHYVGNVHCYGAELAKYEILKTNLEHIS